MSAEIAEVEKLIRLSTYEGVKDVLKSYLSKLVSELPPTPPSIDNEKKDATIKPPVVASTSPSPPSIVPTSSTNITFLPISDFAWDQGEYGSQYVTIYIDLPSIGANKDSVSCKFTKDSFDGCFSLS